MFTGLYTKWDCKIPSCTYYFKKAEMEIALSVHFKGYHKIIKILSWYLTKNVAMFMKNSSYLRPLNTCQKHFETTLPNLSLGECEI